MTKPPGLAPTKTFMVFLFLYVEKVACCATGCVGFFIGNSVPSTISLVAGNFKRKSAGEKYCILTPRPPFDFLPLTTHEIYPGYENVAHLLFIEANKYSQLLVCWMSS